MLHALTVTTPATDPLLITLEDAKRHLKVDYDDDDELITALVLAANDTIEDLTQRRYFSQTLHWVQDRWRRHMRLPVAPNGGYQNVTINAVNYTDMNGTAQVLDPSFYWARPAGATVAIIPRWYVIYPFLGDGAERVSIDFQINVADVPIPAQVAHAARLLVSHWYNNPDAVVGVDNRDSSGPLPLGVETLLFGQRWS